MLLLCSANSFVITEPNVDLLTCLDWIAPALLVRLSFVVTETGAYDLSCLHWSALASLLRLPGWRQAQKVTSPVKRACHCWPLSTKRRLCLQGIINEMASVLLSHLQLPVSDGVVCQVDCLFLFATLQAEELLKSRCWSALIVFCQRFYQDLRRDILCF